MVDLDKKFSIALDVLYRYTKVRVLIKPQSKLKVRSIR